VHNKVQLLNETVVHIWMVRQIFKIHICKWFENFGEWALHGLVLTYTIWSCTEDGFREFISFALMNEFFIMMPFTVR